jgi:hypothetical protein
MSGIKPYRGIGPVPDGLAPGLQDWVEQATRILRDVQSGVAPAGGGRRFGAGGSSGDGSSGGGTLPGGGSTEPDLTPPPTPSGVVCVAGMDFIGITTDPPTFTQGHGYMRTIVYGAKWPTAGSPPAPTFGDAEKVHEFVGEVGSFPTDPATRWRLWCTWVTRDGVESVTPSGGANGHATTPEFTGQDITKLLEILTGQITESQLYADLGERIDLIDAPDTVPGSVAARILTETNARVADVNQEATDRAAAIAAEAAARGTAITNEATLRETADTALAQSISLITAGVAGGFDVGVGYYFDASAEGWTASGAGITWSNGFVDVDSSGTDPQFISPSGLTINGAQYTVVKARIKRLAGSGWDGTCYYTTSGHGFSDSFRKDIAVPSPFDVGDTAVVEFDMTDLTAGGTDWVGNTITRIRLDLGADAADTISVDWVAIGRNAPGASQAGLSEERLARIAADSAEVTARETLATQVRGSYTGTDLALLTSGLLYSERQARSTADSALSTSVTNLSATVTSNFNTLNSAITTEQTARANGDSANASSITSINARLNNFNGTGQNVEARVTAVDTARANGDSALAASIASLTTTVNNNTAAITAEQTARASGDSANAAAITTLQARTESGDLSQFQALHVFNFDATAEGWQPRFAAGTVEGTVTWMAGGFIRYQNTLDSYGYVTRLLSASEQFVGSAAPTLRMRLRPIAGPVPTQVNVIIYNQSQVSVGGVTVNVSLASNTWTVVEVNLSAIAGYDAATVGRIFVSPKTDALRTTDFDWIAVGSRGVGVSSAKVVSIESAVATGDAANASAINAVNARLNSGGDTYNSIVAVQSAASAAQASANNAQDTADTAASQLTTVQSRINAMGGGPNKCRNAAFVTHANGVPDFWGVYNNDGAAVPTTSAIVAGPDGYNAVRVSWTGTNTQTKGIFSQQLASPTKANTMHVYACRVRANSANMVGQKVRMIYTNQPFALFEVIRDPTLTTDWQWYVARGRKNADSSEVYISLVAGAAVANGSYEISQVTVHEGSEFAGFSTELSAAVQQEITTRATQTGALFAQYTVKVDVNGYVAGFGLASTLVNGTPLSNFIIRADRFAVASPSGPGITPITPFIVNTTPVMTGAGEFLPAGVYMSAAYIRDLEVALGRFQNAFITNAMIVSLSATKITAGVISVGNYIQSSNYVSGSSGWRINGDGSAEFSGVTVRGAIFATSGTFNNVTFQSGTTGGIVVEATRVRSSNYVAGSAGFALNSNGTAEFAAASIRGKLVTAQLEVGSVTSVNEPAYVETDTNIPSTDTGFDTGVVSAGSFQMTGVKTIYDGVAKVFVTVNNATISNMRIQARLYVDGVERFEGRITTPVITLNSSRFIEVTIPLIWIGTLAAGTRNFQVRVNGSFFDNTGTAQTPGSSPGRVYSVSFNGKVQENKV